jgi:hypothetical protein
VLTDRQGNSVSGATAEAVEWFDRAIESFNLYRGDPVAMLDRAAGAAPAFAMAHIAKAHLYATTSEPAAMIEARTLLDTAQALELNDRERSHIAALRHLVDGEWTRSALALDRHNMRYPRDLLALQSGHLIDFYRAGTRNLRDRLARVLPEWSPSVPGHSIVLGMHAFGLEECGDYGRAEAEGRRAVAMQPLDCWAHHAVTHVMEMEGRAEDGIGWMIAREPHWAAEDNLFKVHNWWHRALFHLELGQQEEALSLYDGPVREGHGTTALDLVDASALLWRLHVSGMDVTPRWHELADAWEAHADGKTYPFNDWHAVMAFAGAGRTRGVARILAALRASAESGSEAGRWARDIGLPLAEGFVAFMDGAYETATERLHGLRSIANAFGGSHAQRDIIDWTLLEAAIRGGQNEMARALANERRTRKPHSALAADFLARAVAPPSTDT